MTESVELIAGVDEAGRGALAGPVMAAAVVFHPNTTPPSGIKDSKQLSAAVREEMAGAIKAQALAWFVASASHHEIDQHNILQATLLAMQRAVIGLNQPLSLVRVDGNRLPELPHPAIAVIGGDQLFVEVSAASILAKVTRDAHLVELDKSYPDYGFAQHKGYGTKTHLSALQRLGPTPWHRHSFAPVRQSIPTT